jgi:hypothetical protein
MKGMIFEIAWHTKDSPARCSARAPSLRLRRKEGIGKWMKAKEKKKFLYPLSSEAEERVDKRSDVGVSR